MTTSETHDGSGVPSTLLHLVQLLTVQLDSEEEVVHTAAQLVNTGAVRLTGNFRGQQLVLPEAAWQAAARAGWQA